MTEDLISRAETINAIESTDWYHQNQNGEMVHGANSQEHQAWYKSQDVYAAIGRVQTAQPEASLADVMAKYEMLKEHCEILEKANEQLRKTIVYMAMKRMEAEE